MTTTAGLIANTKRLLLSGQREPMNKLNGALTDTATTVDFEFTTGLPPAGSYLQVGLELMLVWEITGQTATVERGQLGSTATAHDDGAMTTVNPYFPDFSIFQALNDEITDLSSPSNGLYAVRSLDLTAASSTGWYDLTGATDVLEILSVRHEVFGTAQWMPLTNYELNNQAGAGFPSGSALRINDGVVSGRTLRVLYKASFDPLTDLADDVETVAGLPASMHDIPPLGAAMRLVAPREIKRNFVESQGSSRRASEVQAGAVLGSMRGVAALRQARITAEAARLMQQHPDRGFIPQSTSAYSVRW